MAPLFQQPFMSGGFPSMNRGVPIDDTSLKAYWKCNQSSGNITNDSISAVTLGSGADGQVTGATHVPSGGSSPFGYELAFDGVNDKLVYGSSLSQFIFMHSTTMKFTLNFWMKSNSLTPRQQIFATMDDSTSTDIGVSIYHETDGSLWFVYDNGVSGQQQGGGSSAGLVPDTTNWYMYSVSVDYSLGSNNFKFYRNASLVSQVNKGVYTPSNSNHTNAGQTGERPDNTSLDLNARISEVSLWSDTLTTRLDELYNSGSGRAIY